VDPDPPAIGVLRRGGLEGRAPGLDARFLVSDVVELPANLEGDFDIVFTSFGALNWLPDLPRWAEVVAHFTRPGGFFYIAEGHPFAWVFDDADDATELRLRYRYWPSPDDPLVFTGGESYADPLHGRDRARLRRVAPARARRRPPAPPLLAQGDQGLGWKGSQSSEEGSVSQYGVAPPAGSLLAQRVLVVRQKLKLVELRNDYDVLDQSGRQVGAVVQASQSPLAFLARLFTSWDVTLPVTLHILGPGATPELIVHKPWFTWRCQVVRPDGLPLGEITKQVRLGRARFALLDPRGARLGEVRAQNWRAKDFSVLDGAGQPIARVTKRWAGLRELFTDADSYVIEVSPYAVDPLRSLAVATCLVIDIVMKQKDYAD
jgi:SAM-dependent methyltransferase/uncharacterized protein YxjI